jgi:hypothetical protein
MDKEKNIYISHTHTMEYYSTIKKNEIMPFAKKDETGDHHVR